MKRMLLASVALTLSWPCFADSGAGPPPEDVPPRPPVTVPPPLGWIYGRYVDCGPYGCVVNVRADGTNVRRYPNGPVFLSLTNGVPLIPLQWSGPWVLVGVPCNLVPTGLWSDTAGVPLDTCGWQPAYPPPSIVYDVPHRAHAEAHPPVVRSPAPIPTPEVHEPPGVPLEGGPVVPLEPSPPSHPPRPYQQR